MFHPLFPPYTYIFSTSSFTSSIMDYKSLLLPVRQFIETIDTIDTVVDHEEYKKLYSMLTICNDRINQCVKSPPDDAKTKEAINKIYKAMDSAKSFLIYSMLHTVDWIPQEDDEEA